MKLRHNFFVSSSLSQKILGLNQVLEDYVISLLETAEKLWYPYFNLL